MTQCNQDYEIWTREVRVYRLIVNGTMLICQQLIQNNHDDGAKVLGYNRQF
jgi:hypothetical protein